MIRTPVASSNISSVGYDPIQQILEVQFLEHPTKKNPGLRGPGDIYDYYDVSQTIYDGLASAPSKGHYLYEVIKRGAYRYQKVFDAMTGEGEPNGISLALSESMLNPANLLTPTVTPIVGVAAAAASPETTTPVGGAISGISSLGE